MGTGIQKAIAIKKAEEMRREMDEIRMKVEMMESIKNRMNGSRKNR
jgi:hypothetical protein